MGLVEEQESKRVQGVQEFLVSTRRAVINWLAVHIRQAGLQ